MEWEEWNYLECLRNCWGTGLHFVCWALGRFDQGEGRVGVGRDLEGKRDNSLCVVL